MEACEGVHSLPCFTMWCTAPHNALVEYGSLALRICTMCAQCISNTQFIGNDEIFCVAVSWCVRCLTCVLCAMDFADCLCARFEQFFEADTYLQHDFCSLFFWTWFARHPR